MSSFNNARNRASSLCTRLRKNGTVNLEPTRVELCGSRTVPPLRKCSLSAVLQPLPTRKNQQGPAKLQRQRFLPALHSKEENKLVCIHSFKEGYNRECRKKEIVEISKPKSEKKRVRKSNLKKEKRFVRIPRTRQERQIKVPSSRQLTTTTP